MDTSRYPSTALILDQGTMDDAKVVIETLWDLYPHIEDLPKYSTDWKSEERTRPDGITKYHAYYAPMGTNSQYLVCARNVDHDVLVWVESWAF